MTSTTTKQFNCPVQGCNKTFNSSLQMGNHIRMMVMNNHEDHSHLMDQVDRTPPQEPEQEEDELPEVEQTTPKETEPTIIQEPEPQEQEDDWIKLERSDPEDRELMEMGYTEVKAEALERGEVYESDLR